MDKTDDLLLELQKIKEENQKLQEENITLKKDIKEAREINEKKNTLISQISHEIRTPLNIVIGMASIAKEELDNINKVRDNLSEIENSSRVLLGIVDNILDISALASGTLKVDANKFDLKEQITSLGIHFYEYAKYKNVHFDIHIQGVEDEHLIGDEKRLQQIMTNLFANSLSFTPEGGKIDLTVLEASSSRNRVHMRFTFQDTGIGLSDSVVEELFLPYEEKKSAGDHTFTDTGINLYVTKQLVAIMGGTINVESKLGEGSRIIVDIPFQKTEQQPMSMTDINKHRVLLVADEPICRERGAMLSDMGIAYDMATDGYHALDMLGQAEDEGNPFSVCMVDMNMKSAYGNALIIEIKKIFGDQPVVIATCYNSKEVENRNLAADYTIENTLFRSTIFDALMKLEKGNLYKFDDLQDYSQVYDFSRKRILVVEDILLNMEVLVKQLSKVNAAVVCTENGKEAVETYMSKPAGYFDCILMDINMPIMDGYDAARLIRRSGKEDARIIPIFAMTANAFSEDVAAAIESGMNGHIAKPIDVQILYKTLHRTFNGIENLELENDFLEKAEKLEIQNSKLKEQAEHDPLTGLYNRYAYEKETYALMRKKEPVGFLLMDIDYFKEINDVYGHEVGDLVLQNVAEVIKSNVRTTDFVVRLGGDEFAVILREFGIIQQILQDKIIKINHTLLHPTQKIPGVTLSVGAAFSDMGYTTELYGNADKALYQTKKNGRNGCTIYNDEDWIKEEEIEKSSHTLADYMNLTSEGRDSMGDMVSLMGYRLLEYSLKVEMGQQYGDSKQKEIFRKAGKNAGELFAEKLLHKECSLDEFMNELTDKLGEMKIARLVLDQYNKETGEIRLSVYESAESSGLPYLEKTVCHYYEGFLSGIFTAYMNRNYSAKEIKCRAKGDPVCTFAVRPE